MSAPQKHTPLKSEGGVGSYSSHLPGALTQSEEVLARLFRTMLHTVDCYNSFLSFEKVRRTHGAAVCAPARPAVPPAHHHHPAD